MDNGAEEDRERDGSTSSSTTWRTCSSTLRMPRIELNGEGEPVWLTPHLRDPQPEGERVKVDVVCCMLFHESSISAMSSAKSKYCKTSTVVHGPPQYPIYGDSKQQW